MTTIPQTSEPTQENKVGAILDLVKIYAWELIKFSWLIAALALLLGWYMYRNKAKIPTTYTAALSFSINESSGADKGFLQQVLGSGMLGITSIDADLGIGDGASRMGMLQELIKTRKALELALFERASLPDKKGVVKEDFFVNHYLELFGYREKWKAQKSPLANIYFKNDSSANFSPDENAMLMTVVGNIIKNNLSDQLSKAGILILRFKSENEAYAYHFLRTFYERLNLYYTEKSIEKQRRIYEAAKVRRDSLEKEMDRAENDYISYLNSHTMAAQGQYAETIEIQYLARKLSGEMEAYFMAIRNVEAAKIALEQQTPLLQAIDKPIFPLPADRPNTFMALVTGVALGTFLGIVIVVGQKALRDFLKNMGNKKEEQTPPTMPTPPTTQGPTP